MHLLTVYLMTLSSSSSLGTTTSGKFWPSQGILSIWDGLMTLSVKLK
jgi:hypothetical protein